MEVDTNEPRKICPPGSRHGPAGRFGPVHPRLCRAGRRSSTAIRVDRDPAPNSASQSVSANDSPVPVDPSQATGEIEVVYQDANGKEHSATISAVAAQAENYACINAGGDPLRVRQGPGTNYGILCSVYDGDRFPITGKTNGWYQILCNGRTGYVSAEFVVVQDNDTVTKPDGDGERHLSQPAGTGNRRVCPSVCGLSLRLRHSRAQYL